MVKSVSASRVDDSGFVGLEGKLVGLDGNGDGSHSQGFEESLFGVDSNILVGRDAEDTFVL